MTPNKYSLIEPKAEALIQLHRILGGGSPVVLKDNDNDLVSWDEISKTWTIGVSARHNLLVAIHEGAHQMWSPLTGETLLTSISQVTSQIWNILEDARIDTMASEWFHQPLWDYHRKELLWDFHRAGTREPETLLGLVLVSTTVLAFHLDLPLPEDSTEFVSIFGDRVRSCTAATAKEVVQLAIEIGLYLSDIQTTELSRASLDVPESEATLELNGTQIPSVVDPSGPDIVPRQQPRHPIDAGKMDTISKNAKVLTSTVLRKTGRSFAVHVDDTVKGYNSSPEDHHYEIVRYEQVPIVLGTSTRILLDTWESSEEGHTHNSRAGMPSHRAWRMNYGDTKVFSKPSRRRGELLVLIDMSGSMNCWCSKCHSEGSFDFDPTNGYLAFQTAGALAQSTSDCSFWGFCSNSHNSIIAPLEPGYQPICRLTGDRRPPTGNPDCVALMFAADKMMSEFSNSSLVIISDGYPAGPAPLSGDHLLKHTRELATEYYNKGLRYASVLLGPDLSMGLYPADVSVNIKTVEDIGNLRWVVDWLKDRGH